MNRNFNQFLQKFHLEHFLLQCSSLGRGGKSWSGKDLVGCLTGGDAFKMQVATDKLHQLYESLRTEEVKDHHTEPFHPHLFLQSLR